jgi:hypothetical protein
MNLALSKLLVMQSHLRDYSQIPQMVEYVRNDGFWTSSTLSMFANKQNIKTSSICEIASFPNDIWMIHDGHHRVASIFLGGRDYLREDEFFIKEWSYDKYLEINFDNKWVTPFHPLLEIRLADIKNFKKKAMDLFLEDAQKAIDFIRLNKNAAKRKLDTIEQLVELEYKNIYRE